MSDSTEDPMFIKGGQMRAQVLGAAHVERSLGKASDFDRPMQEFVTRYAWGEIWGSDDLPLKTRSMLNLAMLTALNRSHELKIHLQGALRNGCTPEEIRAVLMQTAIYCGVPASLEAFRVAREVIENFKP